MKVRKIIVTSALSLSLLVGGTQAFALEMTDTAGTAGEISINKVVSLGIMSAKGSDFLPDEDLTRADFAALIGNLIYLPQGKAVAFKDVKASAAGYANAAKLVNNGILAVSGGQFVPEAGVTYSEFSKALAYGLGLKKSWTTRPVDALFYLERRGVLDITTDLDAVVTREEAAVALDKYISAKQNFAVEEGIAVRVTEKGLAFNDGGNEVAYAFAADVSVFISNNKASTGDLSVGSQVRVTLNKKNQIAFVEADILDNYTGAFKLANGKWVVGGVDKIVNMDVAISPLPDGEQLTVTTLSQYQGEGVEFGGLVFFSTATDEVTAIKPYILKVTDKSFKVTDAKLTVTIAEGLDKVFDLTADTKVTLDGKEAKLADLKAGGKYTATVEANSFGEVTALKVVSVVEEAPAATK